MNDLIQIVKQFTPSQRLNIIFALLLYGCYLLITTLQSDVKIARERSDRIFELYNECVTNKDK
jgi:hypothetical protein